MTESSKAVFLSYASQDAVAALRICDALRTAGIEVWFDQSELRGGDVWDQKIRQQIKDCALFVPVISANTASRHEGYFRLEWDLADQRTHMIARDRAFIVPLCIDGTPDSVTDVPESFVRVHWTRLPDGATPTAFVQRVSKLLSPSADRTSASALPLTASAPKGAALSRSRLPLMLAITAIVGAGGYFAVDGFILSKRVATLATTSRAPAPPAPTAIPEKSIAVLPFIDMSEKKDQEYFSDGLSEELIDLLTKVPELRVSARTSSFYYKSKPTTIAEIAKTLGVAHVLEGSVRRDGDTIRISAQLIRAANGYHLWSETYDRKIGEIFKTQDDIAAAVVQNLKLQLLSSAIPSGRASEHVEAHDLLLKARFFGRRDGEGDQQRSDDCVKRAVALDPDYSLAWVYLFDIYVAEGDARALPTVERALQLDPTLPDAHIAMGSWYMRKDWNWSGADEEFGRALELAPNYALALRAKSSLALRLGRFEEAIALAQRSTELDPVSAGAFDELGHALRHAERWPEAEAAFRRALAISPRDSQARAYLSFMLLNQGHPQAALAEMRKVSDESIRLWGLAIVYSEMGRKTDSDLALAELTQKHANDEPGMISSAHAYRNERDAAFVWLQRAYEQRDAALNWLKVSQFWRKNLAGDPRYEQWLRKLKFAS